MKKKLLYPFFLMTMSLTSNSAFSQTGLDFDGVNDEIVTTAPGVLGNGSRTVEAWVKCSFNTVQRFIVDMGETGVGNGARFSVKINPSSNFLRIEVGGGGLNGTTSITDNTWHHIAAVYDNAATTNKYKLYVDGNLSAQGDISVALNTPTTNGIKIGVRNDGGLGYFDGLIDNVRVWSTALSQTELQQNMALETCSQSNLMVYFNMDEGVASGTNTSVLDIADSSSNGYTGTLNGFALTGTTSNFLAGAPITTPTFDTTISNVNGTLTVGEVSPSATFQWVDCDNSNAPIANEEGASFTPSSNGSYAVIITKNSCTAVSNCVQVTSLSSNSFDFNNKISLYPNPVGSAFNLNLGEIYAKVIVKVINNLGQVVVAQSYSNTNHVSQTLDFSAGVYFVEITTNSGEKAVKRIIKQ
jgi:hypothetical protein